MIQFIFRLIRSIFIAVESLPLKLRGLAHAIQPYILDSARFDRDRDYQDSHSIKVG